MGRVHFGVILGWSVAQSVVIYFIANQVRTVPTERGVACDAGSGHQALNPYSCCVIREECSSPPLRHPHNGRQVD